MIILGKTSDAIGTELERITRVILERRGFSNLTTNLVGSGGQELDVTGDFPSQIPGSSKSRRLIAECKAYRNPVAISDWLKFLGKIYSEQKRLQNEIDGLFVALSGANGNVAGNYDELLKHSAPVTLLHGEELLKEIHTAYPRLLKQDAILSRLHKNTSKNYSSIEIILFDGNFYWVVLFPESSFTLFSQEGKMLNQADVTDLCELIKERLAVTKYISLIEEAETLKILTLIEKEIITKLADVNEKLPLSFLIDNLSHEPPLIQLAFDQLKSKSWITSQDDWLQLGATNGINPIIFKEALLYLMTGATPGNLIKTFFASKFANSNMGDELIALISSTQGGILIDEELKNFMEKVIKVSPSACARCLVPQPMIVTHKNTQPDIKGMDHFDRTILKQILFESIISDFGERGLHELIYATFGLCEMELKQTLTLKTSTNILIEDTVHIRRGIGTLADSLGGGYIGMLLVPDAPQPWEIGGLGNKPTNAPDKTSS